MTNGASGLASLLDDEKAINPGKEIHLRQLFRAQADESLVDLVIRLIEGASIQVKEREHAGGSSTLIPIEERLILSYEEAIGCGLGGERGIGILSERALLRLKDGRFQKFLRAKTGETTVFVEGSCVKVLDDFYGEINDIHLFG